MELSENEISDACHLRTAQEGGGKIHDTRGRAEALAHRRAYALTGRAARADTSHT